MRELQQSGLGQRSNWYNDTIVYTHGYGVVAAYGNQRSTDGQPVFLESGIPTTGSLGTYEPRIYFGQQSPNYSIVGEVLAVEHGAQPGPTSDTVAGSLPVACPVSRSVMSTSNRRAVWAPGGSTTSSRVE